MTIHRHITECVISSHELIALHEMLSADEIALMLQCDPMWRLPYGCTDVRRRMNEGRRVVRHGVRATWKGVAA